MAAENVPEEASMPLPWPSALGNGKGRGAPTPRTLSYSPSWPANDVVEKPSKAAQTPDHMTQDLSACSLATVGLFMLFVAVV